MKNLFRNVWEKLKSFFKNNKKKTIALLVITVFAFIFFGKNNTNIKVGQLENGDIEELVSVSGTVTPNEESSLAFEKSGRIQSINVKVGDAVKVGQILASLSQGSDYASVLNAEANLAAAEANLEGAKNGAGPAELAVKEQAVYSAKENLFSANNSVSDALRSTLSTLSDIVGYKTGNLFTYSSSYRLKYNSCDQTLQSKIEIERNLFDSKLYSLEEDVRNFSVFGLTDQAEINSKIDAVGEKAYKTSIYLSSIISDLDRLLNLQCSISDSTLDSYRSTVSSSKSSLNVALSNLTSLRSQIVTYRNTLKNAEALLNEAKSSAAPEKIKSLEANVSAARANLISAKAVNGKNLIIAPFSGTVTQVNLNLGEISSPNSPAIKLISANNFQFKIKLSEIDLIKVKPGDLARVYLDTYGTTISFPGFVAEVDPAPTTEGNSSSYFAKIEFKDKDERLRPGMNGSSYIITSKKQGSDYILAEYIKVEGASTKVKVIKDINKLSKTTNADDDSNIEWRTITIGVRGTDGKVEVLSGLSKEDKLFPIGEEVLKEKKS